MAVAGAFFVSSALGLALLAVVARWLPPEQNAQFLALWGLVFAFGSVLGSMEQEVARQGAVATLGGRAVPVGAAQSVAVAGAGALLVLGGLLLTTAGHVLTAHSSVIVMLVFISLGGFSMQILTRGVLLGTHALNRYIAVLVGEGVLRLLLVSMLVLDGSDPSLEWAALGIVIGCFSWIPLLGHLIGSIDWRDALLPWGRVTSTVSALAVANGLAAMVLTGFPAVATIAIGSARELGDLFAVMTFSRVPLILLAPVQAMTVPAVIRWIRTGQAARLRSAMRGIAIATLGVTALASVIGFYAGPWAIGLMMGPQYTPGRFTCALVLASTCVLAAALLQAAVLVALERYWLLTICWLVAVMSAAALLTMLPAAAETRGTAGFVAASCVAAVTTRVAVRTCTWTVDDRRPPDRG